MARTSPIAWVKLAVGVPPAFPRKIAASAACALGEACSSTRSATLHGIHFGLSMYEPTITAVSPSSFVSPYLPSLIHHESAKSHTPWVEAPPSAPPVRRHG